MKRKTIEINGKRIQYHRWLVEKSLNKKLSNNEIVHHKDGNESNNNLSNLEVLTVEQHLSLHKAGMPRKTHP